jgi:hypothetical protein
MSQYIVTIVDGRVRIRVDGYPDGVMTLPASYRDAFVANGMLVRFRRGADGKVNEMSIADGRMRDLRAARVK